MKLLNIKRKLFFSILMILVLGLSSITLGSFTKNLSTNSESSSINLATTKNLDDGKEYFAIKSNSYDRINIYWNLSMHPAVNKLDDQAFLNIAISEANNPSGFTEEHRFEKIANHISGYDFFLNLKQNTSYIVDFALFVPGNAAEHILYKYEQTTQTKAGFGFTFDLINLTADSVQVRWNYQLFDKSIRLNYLKLSGKGIDDHILFANNNQFKQNAILINDLNAYWKYDDWSVDIGYDYNKKFIYKIESFTTPGPQIPKVTIGDIETLPSKDGVKINYFLQSNGHKIKSLKVNAPTSSKSIFFITDFLINQENSFEVGDLTDGQTYKGWTIEVYTYEGFASIAYLPDFTVGKDNVATIPPILLKKNLQLISNNGIRVDWIIEDTDNVLTDIKIVGTDINLSLGNKLTGTKIIDDLNYNTTYNDWELLVEYQNGYNIVKSFDQKFDSFTTIAKPNDNTNQNLWWVILLIAIAIILIVALLLGFIGWKYYQKNKVF